MTADITSLDAHEQPSDELRAKWKAYSKTEAADLLARHDIDDLQIPEKAAQFVLAGEIPTEQLRTSFNHLSPDITSKLELHSAPIYYHPLLPGQSQTFCQPSVTFPERGSNLVSRAPHSSVRHTARGAKDIAGSHYPP